MSARVFRPWPWEQQKNATREKLRQIARQLGVPRGRNKRDTIRNLRAFLKTL